MTDEIDPELTSIASILANYAYENIRPVDELVIGKKFKFKYDWLVSNPMEGIQFWKTEDNRVMIALRGTQSFDDVARTWLQIGLSLEHMENKYVPFFNHFDKTTEYIKKGLDFYGTDSKETKLYITGHSLGGRNAIVQQHRFNNSYAFAFNPGQGLLSNDFTSNMYRTFLNDHIGLLIEKLTESAVPFLGTEVSNGLYVIGREWVREKINSYSEFYNEHKSIETHRVENDLISRLAHENMFTKTYPNPNSRFDVLGNHDMEYLMNAVKLAMNHTDLGVENIIPDELIKQTISEIHSHHQFWMLDLYRNKQLFTTQQLLGYKSITDQYELVKMSRNSYRVDVNKFNN